MSKKPPTNEDKVRTISHLADTVAEHLAHVQRHASAAKSAKNKASHDFNMDHATKHVKDAAEHAAKLKAAVNIFPAVARETKALRNAKPGGGK